MARGTRQLVKEHMDQAIKEIRRVGVRWRTIHDLHQPQHTKERAAMDALTQLTEQLGTFAAMADQNL